MQRPSARVVVSLCASLALHLGSYAYLRWSSWLPDPGFELVLPSTIELGVVEGVRLEAPAAAPPEPAQPPPAPPATAAPKPDTAGSQPAAKAPTQAPRKPRASKQKPIPTSVQNSVAKQGLAAVSPPGAQLALRVDLDRIRESVLADDVAHMLAAVPDVRAILEGSEIEPVRDLSRLFLASPNLQRSKLVLAGKYRGDPALPRSAAEKLARARGKEVAWTTQGNVQVAGWENLDSTERVLALIGPSLFAITRADDLPRVLGIARALAERQRTAQRPARGNDADALLAMGDSQVVELTVENARAFVRGGTAHVPQRLVVSAAAPQGDRIPLHAAAEFTSEAEATEALAFWTGLMNQYGRSPILQLLGVAGLLQRSTLTRERDRLEARVELTIDEARLLLRFIRDALGERRPRAGAQPP